MQKISAIYTVQRTISPSCKWHSQSFWWLLIHFSGVGESIFSRTTLYQKLNTENAIIIAREDNNFRRGIQEAIVQIQCQALKLNRGWHSDMWLWPLQFTTNNSLNHSRKVQWWPQQKHVKANIHVQYLILFGVSLFETPWIFAGNTQCIVI